MTSRHVYSHVEQKCLYEPRNLAIVGASTNPESFGARTLANLSGFAGRIYLVNARYQKIGTRRCYASVDALPEAPDCVIVAVPREAVADVIDGCVRRGAGGALLYASGYAETGLADRAALQQRLAAIGRESGMRIVGPNALGLINYRNNFAATFFNVPRKDGLPQQRAIGIVSQSGGLGFSLAQAVSHGVSIGHVLTSGNACDIDVADQVAYLAGDPDCSAIACLFEGMADPQRLIDAAALAADADKPLIVCKIATGVPGAATALSHTGVMAGSTRAYRAAFERAGVIVVDHFEQLVETAAFFGKAPAPSAFGVAVLAASGGASVIAADKAEANGVALDQPSASTTRILTQHIPEFGSARNPCDVTAQVTRDPALFAECAGALFADPAFGAVVMAHTFAYDYATPRLIQAGDLAGASGKIGCAVWMSEALEGPGAIEAEMHPHLAIFRSNDRCFATLAAWHRHAAWKAQPRGRKSGSRIADPAAVQAAAALLDRSDHLTLTEREAKAVLALYGVPVVGERLVADVPAAVAAAESFGYPAVIKVESPDLPHKTEAGVIQLNLRDAAEVASAWDIIMANAHKVEPSPRINGVLVQAMVPSGVEVMVGARIDAQFGPLIVVGLGGVLVELLQDTAVGLAPVDSLQARAMLEGLKGYAVLRGFRGAPAVDIDRLADIIARISELGADQASRIAELDVNPLICRGQHIAAVDALIVRRKMKSRR